MKIGELEVNLYEAGYNTAIFLDRLPHAALRWNDAVLGHPDYIQGFNDALGDLALEVMDKYEETRLFREAQKILIETWAHTSAGMNG